MKESWIIAAKQLLGNNHFQEVLRFLADLDRKVLSPDQNALYCVIFAEAKINLGAYDVRDYLEEAIEYYAETHDDILLARAKHLLGWLLISLGDHFDAREPLIESYAIYKRIDKKFEQARILNRLAFLSYQLGEVESAINYMRRCISLYGQLKDESRRLIVSVNLGVLYTAVGQLAKAIRTFNPIESAFDNWDDDRNKSVFLFQMPIPYAQKGQCRRALDIIAKSPNYLGAYSREKAIYYENLGWIHLLAAEYVEAEDALLKGLKISLEIAPQSALVSQIKRRLADSCFGLNKFDLAKQYAGEALIVAEKINERVEIAAVWRVYAQLAVHDVDHAAARDWFKKAIEMFAMISSRYELAATRYLAAISGVYQNGERQALLYMAREYFESEGVTHYIAKIDAALAQGQRQPMTRRKSSDSDEPKIIAANRAMRRLVALAEHVAPSSMAVLLTGPTGSGKDLLARYIHYHSERSGRFISINVAAIPDQMIESELFGYKKGAYTGADQATTGLIEEADAGTLYLNEIADSTLEMQAKLLDVLETRHVRRLGERDQRKVDFRLICATNHDVEQMIRDGKFRADLYHRLNEIPITLPALSDRREDIGPLAEYFLKEKKIEPDGDKAFGELVEILSSLDWPGNVRELRADVERLALIAEGRIDRMVGLASRKASTEREQLLQMLMRFDWNRTEVARQLGISEGAVRHRMKKYGLTPAHKTR